MVVVKAANTENCDDATLYPPPDATVECLKRKEDDLYNQLQLSESATAPLEGQVASLSKELDSLQAQITSAKKKVLDLTDNITNRDKDIASRYVVFGQRVRSYYEDSRSELSFGQLVQKMDAASNFNEFLLNIAYGERVANEDKDYIVGITKDILSLESDKKQVENTKTQLDAMQSKLDTQKTFFDGEIAKAKVWQAQLNDQIATLTAKQQQLLAAKLAGLNIPLFAVAGGGCSSDLTNGKNPGFSGGFGFFTFGVPNRVGLNQYGAWGRAKAGKSYDEILRAYYTFDAYQDMSATIKVNNGNGINTGSVIWSGSLEDYVKRIYEVPNEWGDQGGMEALKAQAVAVRSYVLAATNNGSSTICATQSCQVFKTSPKGGNWDNAVNSTSGKAMIQGGKPIKAYFSSTHGGYAFNTGDLQGWSSTPFTKRLVDTPSGSVSSINDLRSNAYDKDSPWMYCDWGGRSQYGGTAWLKPEEVADIVNVLLLAKQDSSSQPHLTQVDKPNPDGTDTWSADTVRAKLSGAGYTTVDSISPSFDLGSGRTTQVTVTGSGHTNTFSGDEFRSYFTLRAPANIQIVGPLFNVERR